MKLIVLKDDNMVEVDGVSVNAEFTIPDNIHAIIWDGTQGHIEYKDGQRNVAITDISEWTYLADEHATFRAQREAERAAAIQAAEDALTYDQRRAREYPTIGDQLDMIFRAGLGGDEFQAAIQAIKNKYPKS